MKVYLSTWPHELSQKRTLDKRGAKRRLISYEHIRSAKSKDARQVLKEYGLLKTPKAEAIENYRAGYDKIEWAKPQYIIDYATVEDIRPRPPVPRGKRGTIPWPEPAGMHEVLQRAGKHLGGLVSPITIGRFIEEKQGPSLALVVRRCPAIVGVALSRQEEEPGVWRTHMSAVAEQYRGQGLGRALAVATWECLRSRGVHTWRREVPQYNTENIALLTRLGFERTSVKYSKKKGTPIFIFALDPSATPVPKYWHELAEGRPHVVSRLLQAHDGVTESSREDAEPPTV